MSWSERLRARLRPMVKRSAAESRMDEEMRLHLEMETEKNLRQGMGPEEARRRALAVFGGVEAHKEEMRSDRSFGVLEDGVHDVRYAWRGLVRAPGFALAAVLTIGLGIGANTAIFGVVDALFLQYPAGVQDAEDVRLLYIARDEGSVQTGPDGGAGSYLDFLAVRRNVRGFSEVAGFLYPRELDLNRGEAAQRIRGGAVTHQFFPLLGIRAAEGRLFLPEEDSVSGTHPVAVISHAFWKRHFGADPAVLGQTLLLNGQQLTIVGVTQERFTGIYPEPVDVWVPTAMAAPLGLAFAEGWRSEAAMIMVNVIGRLAEGADESAAAASATAALTHLAEAHPNIDPTPGVRLGSLIPAAGPFSSPATDLALWLLIVTGLVLVIACANVANLVLARATTRRRETAIRLSIGAGRRRLVRQNLTESLVISLLGGCAGFLLALWGTRLVRQFPLPPSAAELSVRPLLFALGLAAITGIVFGLVPALQAGRTDPVEGLKESHAGAGPGRGRLRRVLVGVQVAVSVMLLVGAGLFVRSLREVHAVDPGLDVDRLLLVSVDLRQVGFDEADRESFYNAAQERVMRVPGVSDAAMTHFRPLTGMSYSGAFQVPGQDSLFRDDPPSFNWVASGYFEVTGTSILRGRGFMPEDRVGEPVAMVNESLAQRLGTGDAVVGTCLIVAEQVREGGCTRIVGVVENQRRNFLVAEVKPYLYLSRDQEPEPLSWGGSTLVVRTEPGSPEVAAAVRSALQSLDPRLPFVAVQPLSEQVRDDILPYRLGATLFSLFGVLALVLAGVGLYGVLGYFVAERRPEIGIRRSLGAEDAQVVRLVVREGMLPVVMGLLAGLAAAFFGGRLLEALLFGVEARDPLSFAAAAGFLFLVSLLASYLPARRAAQVDPMVALRAE